MKRILSVILLTLTALSLQAGSFVNFGFNFRLTMPYETYENTDWNSILSEETTVPELENFVNDDSKGYAGGLFLRLNKGKSFLHTEAMLSMSKTGFTAVDVSSSGIFSYQTKSSGLNVPIFYGYNLFDMRLFKIRVFTGPQFQCIMNTSVSGTYNGDEIEDFASDFTYEDFDWLWYVGGGVEVFVFSLDVRYGFDIKGVECMYDLENSFNQNTNMLEFTLGFKLF